MKISVVTVCRNSEKTIGLTIRSFLEQAHADKELWIIDGASTDSTPDIVRSFDSPEVHFLSEKDAGIYDAMNKGLDRFNGEAVGFLGSDDTFHNSRSLADIAAALAHADIAYGDLHMVKDHVSKHVVRVWKSGEFQRKAFARGWMPAHPTFYVRRTVVDAVGRFDLGYDIGADYDFVLRSMTMGRFRVRYIPKILVDFQLGGLSSKGLRSALHQNIECLRARRRYMGAPMIDLAFFLKPARKLLQFR
jgi:glycosyltransferase